MRRELARRPWRSSTNSGSVLRLRRSFDPHIDRSQRLTQVVPHDCDEPFPQRGRLFGTLPLRLGGMEELRVVHRRGCAPCQFLRKDQVMLVVDPRGRCCEDDHGEGSPPQDDRDEDGRGDAKPPSQGQKLIVRLLGKKPLWSYPGMELGTSRSHHAAAGSGHSIGALTLQILNGGEQLRVRGVVQRETRLTLLIPQMDRHSVRKAGTAMRVTVNRIWSESSDSPRRREASARIAMRCSACFCSVMSRVTLAKPRRRPALSCSAVRTTCAQKREPSLRTRSPSSVTTPCSVARRSNRPGTPASHPPEHGSGQTTGR